MNSDNLSESLSAMYENAGLPVIITDSDFYVIFASAVARELSPGAALPGGVRELLSSFDLDDVRSEIEHLGSFSIPGVDWLFSERSTIICAVPDGGHYLLQPAPIQPQGIGTRPDGVSRALAAFASQYRTPLSNIFSMLSLLGGSGFGAAAADYVGTAADSAKLTECLRVINDNAYRLLRTSRWVTDYAQLSNGITSERRSRIDLYSFMRELINATDNHVEDSEITMEYEIPTGVLFTVCDTELLQNALLNILSNSYRYTRDGNHIRVCVKKNSATSASISISDRGAGIAPDVQAHVFEPYFSRGLDGNPFAGCGLGLTIARDSILALGGSIKLVSTEGEGTTVVFTLPIFDDPSIPDTLHSDSAENMPSRFSPLVVALSDCIRPPI